MKRYFALIAFLLLFLSLISCKKKDNGMYATFITSMGNFTCELYFEKTPLTVANFVGLAEELLNLLMLILRKKQKSHFIIILFFIE